MTTGTAPDPAGGYALHRARVIRVEEGSCEVVGVDGGGRVVPFAPVFPTPRTERVSPGHLVAIATGPGGAERAERVVWRWYDAVVLGDGPDGPGGPIWLWEPGHGEVLASRRPGCRPCPPGTRVYASAGLPGASWWVADAVDVGFAGAAVELDEVDALYRDNGLWPAAFAGPEGAGRG